MKKLGEYLGDILPLIVLMYAIVGGIPVLYTAYISGGDYRTLVALAVYVGLIVLLLKWLWPYYNADNGQTPEIKGDKH